MKTIKLLLGLLTVLCLTTLFCLVGCTEQVPPDEDATVIIAEDGKSEYRIVYTPNSSLSGRWANKIKEELKLTENPSVDSSEYELEILVGDTSRTLSEELKSAALDGKPEDSWVWAFAYKDGKLAIYANCQSAFDMALQALRDEYIKDGVFSVSNKLLCLCKLIYLPQLV